MSWLSGLVSGISSALDPLSWFRETESGSPTSALTGENGLFSNPVGAWDKFKNGATNDVNERIANQNLEYQRERNKIEDERYAEETAYNRAFAEEERDYQRAFAEDERSYNRALQQQLFEREDTALERQASSLSSMGINPLSQQLNGLGAGQAVTSSAPVSAGAPASSSRGGTALHNDFQMQDMGVMQALAPLASLANTINQVATGQGQRDLLQAQADKQYLDNYITAMRSGIWPRWNNSKYGKYEENRTPSGGFFNSENLKNIDNRNLINLDIENKYKPEWARNMNYLVSDDFFQAAEKALTRGSELFEKSMNKVFDNDSDKIKFNPFKSFIELFF